MPTLTVRRLDEADRDWLRNAARSQGISMEECVRQMIRMARLAATRRFGDVLDEMNASLDDETRALLGDPPVLERPPLRARDVFPGQEDGTSARVAS